MSTSWPTQTVVSLTVSVAVVRTKRLKGCGGHSCIWQLSTFRVEIPAFILLVIFVNSFICNLYTFQRDTQCCSTDCLLMHRCQLYMFRTVKGHPQELLFRCCMCRYVPLVQRLRKNYSSSSKVAPAGRT